MERVKIKNFACLSNITVELNKLNLFVGKQASGKSITIKILYFFKNVARVIQDGIFEEKDKRQVDRDIITLFESYFPPATWNDKSSELLYEVENDFIALNIDDKSKVRLTYSANFAKCFTQFKKYLKTATAESRSNDQYIGSFRLRSDYSRRCEAYLKSFLDIHATGTQIFIPAGRSFFSNLSNNIFSFISASEGPFALDPFLTRFGSLYESIKNLDNEPQRRSDSLSKARREVDGLIEQILGGKFVREGKKDVLIHRDTRKTSLNYASSGQQEILPLLLILKSLTHRYFSDQTVLYIEEPEAHLFPEAQKKIVELISLISNIRLQRLVIIITTHSPYILSSFNNHLQAGNLYKNANPELKSKINSIIQTDKLLVSDNLNAYAMRNGNIDQIVNSEYGLIDGDYIDSVSEEISSEFSKLLELETE